MATPLQSLVTPSLGASPNVPSDLLAFGTAVEKQIIMSFATSTARDAAVTVPVSGMQAWLTTPKQLTMYDGTAWVIMSEPAQTFTAVVKQNGATIASTTTRATYHRSDRWCDAVFAIGITAAGTVGTELKVTPTGLPAAATNSILAAGTFNYNDAGTAIYFGSITWDGTDLKFLAHNVAANLGANPSFAAANTDALNGYMRFYTG